jgi:hypothetical protein
MDTSGGSRQKHDSKTPFANGVRSARDAVRAVVAQGPNPVLGVLSVLQEDRLHVRMFLKDLD